MLGSWPKNEELDLSCEVWHFCWKKLKPIRKFSSFACLFLTKNSGTKRQHWKILIFLNMIILVVNLLLNVMLIMDLFLVKTLSYLKNGINTFSVFIFSFKTFLFICVVKVIFFFFWFKCQTSDNFTLCPHYYGTKRMNRFEAPNPMLAGSFTFQVDDLEVFCLS